jgi:riboflavin biosynthesis pyrimidine reductase
VYGWRLTLSSPFQTLYEAPGLAASVVTPGLEEMYGGGLGFDGPSVYANFVSTIDGVVAITSVSQSNKLIRAGSDADCFVMGLLRAFADVVLVGAGTLAAAPRGSWMPERAFPPAAAEYAALRSKLGKPEQPEIAILTGSGSIDPGHPALEAGSLVLTSDQGAALLEGRLPPASTLVALGNGPVFDPQAVIGALRDRGHGLILSEAGPHGFGSLVEAGLVDELFLTVSPLLAGGSAAGDRLGLVEGVEFLSARPVATRVLSVKRQDEHLFLRYAID